MTRHDEIRELLALRLYGELDAEGHEQVARHLPGCEACTAFASELERGLGRLAARPDDAFDELPAGWRESVAIAALAERPARRSRLFPGWQLAAGFLLGLLTAWALLRAAPPADPRDTSVVQQPAPRAGAAATSDVPRSTGGPGPLARLAAQRRG